MNNTYEIEWTELSRQDYDNLDGSQCVFVDKALARIQNIGMSAGVPLHNELFGCNKMKHKKMGLRVVFRQSMSGIEVIQIVAIGARENSYVYNEAIKRLRNEDIT